MTSALISNTAAHTAAHTATETGTASTQCDTAIAPVPPRRISPNKQAVHRPYLAAVPDCEPPFDDERSAASRIQQLRQVQRAKPSTVGAPHRVVDAAVPGWSQEPDIGVRRTTTAELPPAARSGPVLARALVEVLSSQRPLSQLRVHCAPEVFAGLQSRQINTGSLSHLLNVRVCEPADGVAEVSVVFRRGNRVRALAFRIQGVDGRWRVTALQTG